LSRRFIDGTATLFLLSVALLRYDVFFKLIDYTNDRYQVVPGFKKTSGAEDVDHTAIMPVRDKLWESDDVINRIVTDNSFCFA
jgi:hypothetical protein